MPWRCTAVVERGFLRPTTPLALVEGTQVELIIFQSANGNGQRSPADILAEIASEPMEEGGKEVSGRDHDQILYGDGGA